MRILFHGGNAAAFVEGFAGLVGTEAEIGCLPDALATEDDRAAYAAAEVIVGIRLDASLPRPSGLRLFLVPGAGTDGVDAALLPAGVALCNCFGHEAAIAEYVMAALLRRRVPLEDADRRLRAGDWAYWAGARERTHGEVAGSTIGLLGFGHIAKAVAVRARAFDMRVHVANRSPVASDLVDRAYPLSDLPAFCAGVDALVVTVPLTGETRGLIGREALAAMRRDAVLVNVARGPVVEEGALHEALREGRIGGAVLDTWYRYPDAGHPFGPPSAFDFAALPNVMMTPHMSGWTMGTIRRRQETMAENVRRLTRGEALLNVVHPR